MRERLRRTCTTLVAAFVLVGAVSCAPTPRAVPAPATPEAAQVEMSDEVRAYVDAVAEEDLDALVDAFDPGAQILDTTRRVSGSAAIRTWAETAIIGGTLRVDQVTEAGPQTQRLGVFWTAPGAPGRGGSYVFTVRDGKILQANFSYARAPSPPDRPGG